MRGVVCVWRVIRSKRAWFVCLRRESGIRSDTTAARAGEEEEQSKEEEQGWFCGRDRSAATSGGLVAGFCGGIVVLVACLFVIVFFGDGVGCLGGVLGGVVLGGGIVGVGRAVLLGIVVLG